MATRNLDRAMKRLATTLEPPTVLHQREATRRAVDVQGRLTPQAIADARDPQTIVWKPADTGGDAAVRAGTATLIRAYATTAPTAGTAGATITITKVTEFGGSEDLPTVNIPAEVNFGTEVIATPVEAGAWFVRTVTTANGASGISVQLVIQPGS